MNFGAGHEEHVKYTQWLKLWLGHLQHLYSSEH